ncbi:SRPBCC family protein [Nocardia coubleae]|uniref:SRPBCC family protein n=1 Tax=Nocardia coubleae TaxID=356147 RepID=A0A846W313_9NOCA|nr:SRPBCC family protein [Nocardia coubleae]NKX87180.1 SRPBCC family protein [Nocardia coubleae]
MPSSTVETVLDAPRDIVYRLFSERESVSPHLPIQVKLVKQGDAVTGIGAQHLLGFGKLGVTEEITALVPGERMEYKIVKGAPVKRHVGIITFADTAEGGTRVVYTMESEPSLPVPAKAMEFGLRQLTNQLIGGIRKALR